ncbi:hypothetical protein L1987_11759 [Smallanthus sonchifolius]|uniref:Uncharacterized protein n=1 Tax=Smallanthus sonchifolius TaxID=185202 RepID=A0ACB9JC74_9ASTR|nr:hypothetical protein L1987_11759 [Smallanthus sonchifolius]
MVRWNVCHALSNLFLNETSKLQDTDCVEAPSVFSILLLLLRDYSNFKIRIQAAAALAAPPTILAFETHMIGCKTCRCSPCFCV